MGKLREKKWDWPRFGMLPLVLSLLFLGGGLAGCLYAAGLRGTGAVAVADYLSDYFALLSVEDLSPAFCPVFQKRLLLWLYAVLCGLTGLGLIGIPLLCGTQGFFLSYSAACFYRVFGLRGLGAAAILVGLPAMFWLPVLLLLGCQSMKSAAGLLRRVLGEGAAGPIFTRLYGLNILAGAGGMVLCAAMEYGAVPVLLRILAAQIV